MFRALCARHQDVNIVLYSIWYHHTCRWPSLARDGHLQMWPPDDEHIVLETCRDILTYSMVQRPPWVANWFAASQEIPRISRNPKVHYRTHKRTPLFCAMLPLETLPPGDLSWVVVYLRIVLSPEQASHLRMFLNNFISWYCFLSVQYLNYISVFQLIALN